MKEAFEANAIDLLAYLERRVDPRSAAADVLADAMVVAWRRVENLPPNPERARMWLFVIARNTLANHRRSLGRYRVAVDRLRGIIIDDIAAATSEIEMADVRMSVRDALATLPAADAELVRLVNWEQFTLVQVADLEGIAPSTVRSRYAKALQKLASHLEPASAHKDQSGPIDV